METPPVAVKKSVLSSLSKASLTPCRRVGLGRPSSGSLKKAHLVRSLTSPVPEPKDNLLHQEEKSSLVSEEPPTIFCGYGLTDPSLDNRNVVYKSTNQRSRRCLTVSSNAGLKSDKSHKVLKQCNNENIVTENVTKKRKVNLNNIEEIKKDIPVISRNIQKEQSSDHVTSGSSLDLLLNSTKEVTPDMIKETALSIREKTKMLEKLRVQEAYEKKHDLVELRQQTTKWRTAGQEALRYSLRLASQAGYCVTLKQLMSQHGFPPHLMRYNSEDDEFD